MLPLLGLNEGSGGGRGIHRHTDETSSRFETNERQNWTKNLPGIVIEACFPAELRGRS